MFVDNNKSNSDIFHVHFTLSCRITTSNVNNSIIIMCWCNVINCTHHSITPQQKMHKSLSSHPFPNVFFCKSWSNYFLLVLGILLFIDDIDNVTHCVIYSYMWCCRCYLSPCKSIYSPRRSNIFTVLQCLLESSIKKEQELWSVDVEVHSSDVLQTSVIYE